MGLSGRRLGAVVVSDVGVALQVWSITNKRWRSVEWSGTTCRVDPQNYKYHSAALVSITLRPCN